MRNIYDLAHVNGDIYDVEADCYERDGEDWVFFDGDGKEVHRVCWLDILSVSKSRLRPAPPQAEPERVWI